MNNEYKFSMNNWYANFGIIDFELRRVKENSALCIHVNYKLGIYNELIMNK